MVVELIYDPDCPHVRETRRQLLAAFAAAELTPCWQEWAHNAPESPAYVRDLGSPTILVNGKDIANSTPSGDADCCRVYIDEAGRLTGTPSMVHIVSALNMNKVAVSANADGASQRSVWRNGVPTLPAIGVALLPKLTCPACWPAYAGLMSAAGLSFVNYSAYLPLLTGVFLLISLAALGVGATRRRDYKPFGLGLLAVAMIMVGKFMYGSAPALYAGITLLVAASFWNTWPKKARGLCPTCVPAESPSLSEHKS